LGSSTIQQRFTPNWRPILRNRLENARTESIQLDLSELGWGRFDSGLEIAEEQFVRAVNTINHILRRLCIKHVPVVVLGEPLEFREVFHQVVLAQGLAGQLVITSVKGDGVVPDLTSYVHTPIETLVLL
jgi:hypothetical protein